MDLQPLLLKGEQPIAMDSIDWSQLLWNFASSLKSHPHYVKIGGQMCERVLKALIEELKHGVDGVATGIQPKALSSYITRKDVILPEYQVMLRVEKRFQQGALMNVLCKILQSCDYFGIVRGSVENISKHSTEFMFTNGTKVKMIVTSDEGNDEYCEKYEEFLNDQDEFTGNLLRLVKFWYRAKSPFFDLGEEQWKVLELITIAAAMDMEEHTSNRFLQGFNRVIDVIMEIKNMKLTFERQRKEAWDVVYMENLKMNIRKECEAKWIKKSTADDNSPSTSEPALVCPVSGENLLADPVVKSKIPRFLHFARGAKACLASLLSQAYTVNYGGQKLVEYEKFFDPLPLPRQKRLGFPRHYCIEFEDKYEHGVLSYVRISSEDLLSDDKHVRGFVFRMKEYLIGIVGSIMRTGWQRAELGNCVERGIRKFVKSYLLGCVEVEDESEKFWDVSYNIPYWAENEGVSGCVTLSLAW